MREELSKILSEVNSQDSYLKALHRHASIDMLSGLLNRAATERSIKSCKRKTSRPAWESIWPERDRSLRGTVSVCGSGPLQGQEGRQAPVLAEKAGQRKGKQRVPAFQRHYAQRPSGEYGERRGATRDRGGPSGHLCQP